jgi:hypothetical protein
LCGLWSLRGLSCSFSLSLSLSLYHPMDVSFWICSCWWSDTVWVAAVLSSIAMYV